MRNINSKVRTNFISEEGTYLQNKDYFAFVELDSYACYVIADGLDDDTQQESAQIAVTSFIKDFTDRPSMMNSVIRRYINNANKALIKSSRNMRLKASFTVVVSNYSEIKYAVVGNSRFYYFKDGHLREKSRDESLTEDMAQKGMISLDKVSEHIERNNLTSYLGENKLDKPFISKKIKLSDGDAFALLTRGIWENCDEREIEDALEGASEPAEVIDNVEELILSRQPEVIENYTMALTFFDKVFVNPNKSKKIRKVVMAAVSIVMALAVVGLIVGMKVKKRTDSIEKMNTSIVSGDQYLENSNPLRASEEYKTAREIAEKYKLKDELAQLDEKMKYTEAINLGDEKLKDEKYDEAIEQYKVALNNSAKFDYRSKNYIESKIKLANDCLQINEFMEFGDIELENKNYAAANFNYKQAKELASRANLTDKRNAAQDKMKEATEALNTENAAKKAEEESKKQELEKYNDKGNEYMQNGNNALTLGSYMIAKKQYELAKEQFKLSKNEILVTEMDKKLKNLEALISIRRSEADQYVNEARSLASQGKTEEAKEKYRKAKTIYEGLEMIEKLKNIEEEMNKL